MTRRSDGEDREELGLRLGVFLDGRCLEERIFGESRSLEVGRRPRGNDVVVPSESLPPSRQLLIRRDGTLFLRLRATDEVRISVEDEQGRRLVNAEELVSGEASGGEKVVPLDSSMRGKISIGEVSFLFHFVQKPKRRPPEKLPRAFTGGWWRGLNRYSAAAIALSALLQVGFLGWVLSQEWPEQLEADLLVDNSFAEIYVESRQKVEVPEASPEPDNSSDAATDDTTAGPQRQERDEQQAEAAESQESEPAEPSADPSEPLRMSERVENETLLGVLGSRGEGGDSAIDQMLAATGSADMSDAFAGASKLRSDKLGADKMRTEAQEGERGGRTVSVGAPQKLGGAHRGEHGVETGEKAEERVECVGCRMVVPPPEDDGVDPALDGAAISSAIRRIQGRLRGCFERQAKKYPGLSGKVVVTFTVGKRGSRGRVVDSRPSVDMVGKGVGECVARQIGRLSLPAPANDRVVVNKAFVFESGG